MYGRLRLFLMMAMRMASVPTNAGQRRNRLTTLKEGIGLLGRPQKNTTSRCSSDLSVSCVFASMEVVQPMAIDAACYSMVIKLR